MGEGDPEEPGGCTKFVFAILDVIAAVFRCIMAVVTAIKICVQNTCYPIKESIIAFTDDWHFKVNPYKKKVPYTHVPQFSY